MPDVTNETRELFFSGAVREALDEELARDENVVLMGEDIGCYGGAFGVTAGLLDKYGPSRIIETPISENSFVGVAVGAAMLGLRPVVEIMFMDFIGLAMDQLLNSASKLHYMYNGQVTVPLVIRTPGGAKGGYGPSHSQMLSNLFVGIPGLRVVAPSDSARAKGLLKSAIRDPNPVLFIENKRLYPERCFVPSGSNALSPLDKASVAAEGTDVTVITYSAMVPVCLAVRRALAGKGVDIEVVDLVSLQPVDRETLFSSVRKTGRVVLVEEGCVTGGVGAEISALIAEHCMDVLEAPIMRVAAKDRPIPASPELEKHVLPTAQDIANAVAQVMQW